VMKVSVPNSRVPDGGEVTKAAIQPQQRRDSKVVVLGDTHGQLNDLMWGLACLGLPSPLNPYVVNGDIADRGNMGMEIFAVMLCFMLQFPKHNAVVINRGNHECLTMNGAMGFKTEISGKYGPDWGNLILEMFGDVFALLPTCSVIGGSICVVHGGVSRNPEQQMKLLAELPAGVRRPEINPRRIVGDPHMDCFEDCHWADPQDTQGSTPSTVENGGRGCSHFWGPDYTARFLNASGYKMIIRSHQVPKDNNGVFVHESHFQRVLTVFSASNYGHTRNRAGAVLVYGSGTQLEYCPMDLGFCPPFEIVVKQLSKGSAGTIPNFGIAAEVEAMQQQADPHNKSLQKEIKQQAMALFVENKTVLWENCVANDSALTGYLPMETWIPICATSTGISDLDWELVTQLVADVIEGNVEYMRLLGRFHVTVAAPIKNDVNERIVNDLFKKIMNADASLHQLIGSFCSKTGPAQPMILERFAGMLQGAGLSASEVAAVQRSVQAYSGAKGTVDIAACFSAWNIGSGMRSELQFPPHLDQLVDRLALLMVTDTNGLVPRSPSAVAQALMDFFVSADQDGDGYMSLGEFEQRIREQIADKHFDCRSEDLQEILRAADFTGDGNMNFLEFLRLFGRRETGAASIASLNMMDALSFLIWLHRNALAALFRFIGVHGKVTREQVLWAFSCLQRVANGDLDDDKVATLVDGITFDANGKIDAAALLSAFKLIDLG